MLRAGDLHGRLLRYEQSAEQLLLGTLTTGIAPGTLRQIARGKLAETLADYDPMEVLRPHLDKAPPAEVGLVNSMRYLDVKLTLGGGILTKLDRASMAVSLEARPVFLNRRVLDLAGRIPPSLLADRAEPKKVLREALREWLPPSVLDRPKQGFAMPLGQWFRGDLQGLADSAVSNDALADLVDHRHTASVATAHAAGASGTTSELHSLVLLQHWLEKWS